VIPGGNRDISSVIVLHLLLVQRGRITREYPSSTVGGLDFSLEERQDDMKAGSLS
jgi:hypothetical protein